MTLKLRFLVTLLVVTVGMVTMVSCAASGGGVTTVVVVRHAEKRIEAGNRDPALTVGGLKRAEALAHVLMDVPIEAVYSSDYKRTRTTAAPISGQFGVETVIYDPRDSDGLRDAILRDHRGGAVLVVGHSNTVPALLASFGVMNPPEIADGQYDDCFVVLIADDPVADGVGPVMLSLHYGEPGPARGLRGLRGTRGKP